MAMLPSMMSSFGVLWCGSHVQVDWSSRWDPALNASSAVLLERSLKWVTDITDDAVLQSMPLLLSTVRLPSISNPPSAAGPNKQGAWVVFEQGLMVAARARPLVSPNAATSASMAPGHRAMNR